MTNELELSREWWRLDSASVESERPRPRTHATHCAGLVDMAHASGRADVAV